MSRSVLPSRSAPPAAAKRRQVRQHQVRLNLLVARGLGGAVGGDQRRGADAKVTGRSGASSCADTSSVTGRRGEEVGLWAGHMQVPDVGMQIDLAGVALDIGVQAPMRAPPAFRASILMVPLASGLVNGPCTLASTRIDCQDTPGRASSPGPAP